MILISKCDFCGKKNVKGYRGLDPYGNDINGDEEIYSICDVCSKERAAEV